MILNSCSISAVKNYINRKPEIVRLTPLYDFASPERGDQRVASIEFKATKSPTDILSSIYQINEISSRAQLFLELKSTEIVLHILQ